MDANTVSIYHADFPDIERCFQVVIELAPEFVYRLVLCPC